MEGMCTCSPKLATAECILKHGKWNQIQRNCM
jgi:hypothetical protein